ncbi:unnamed protein product [Chironomus riparius]|uniref:F-box domain-containing protein n=1 Tax=Chironomus riparius TaxID=315576 RepID=A0A9N9S3N0_9DIPT|nr:unnamed protein product [Chironomus riparius]
MINQLPQNILIEIFSHLDANFLGLACQVCRLWSYVIRTTPKIMKRAKVKITSDRTEDDITIFDQVPFGLHQNIEVVDYCGDFVILQQILTMHRNYIEYVKIVRPDVWCAKMFTETFSSLKNLSRLILDNCQLRDMKEIKESGENFVNLRHLTVVDCCCEIFDIFRDCNLASLTVEYSPNFIPAEQFSMKSLTNLLKYSSTITNLTVVGVTKFPDNFLTTKSTYKFHLQQLTMDDIEGLEDSYPAQFLESQRGTLKKLSILKPPESEKLQNLINEIRCSIDCDKALC